MSRILYIGGAGRSGSTLLELLLGNEANLFSVGEVRFFWQYSQSADHRCGCGAELHTCEFWSRVVKRLADSESDLESLGQLASRWDRTRRVPKLARRLARPSGGLETLLDGTGQLYRAVEREARDATLVDSSKVPSHLHLLTRLEGMDVRLLHLVRDPRAVAYAWRRRRKTERGIIASDGVRMPARSYLLATLVWAVENFFVGRLARRQSAACLVRYEDLVADPAGTLTRVARELDLDPFELRALEGKQARLEPTHSVGGNPLRFGPTKSTVIRSDQEWRQKMSPGLRIVLGLLVLPLLKRYGYRL